MADMGITELTKIVKTNRLLLWGILILLALLTGAVYMKTSREATPAQGSIVTPDPGGGTDPGPGPIGSGKIRKPGSAGSDYMLIIDLGVVTADKAGDSFMLHESLFDQSVSTFESTYAHSGGSGTYAIASTTLKIDNDRDGVFEPADGEIELHISRVTCGTSTCLEWKDLTSGRDFERCSPLASGTYTQCVKSGIPPEFFGLPVDEGWQVTPQDASDPTQNPTGNAVEEVYFELS